MQYIFRTVGTLASNDLEQELKIVSKEARK